jgi:hypothetical protein
MQARSIIISLVLLTSARPASAQVLHGRVLEDASERPIGQATVELLEATSHRSVMVVITDSLGRFMLRPTTRGEFKLRTASLGFREATSAKFPLGPIDTLELEMRLKVDAVLLAPLTVTASARPWHEMMKPPGLWPFYERKSFMEKLGLGRFVTRDLIDNWAGNVTQLVGTVPGVVITSNGRTQSVAIRRSVPGLGSGECQPLFFLNGAKINLAGMSLDDFVDVTTLEAVEVYRGPSELPGEYAGSDARCGAIGLWTRRGG